MDNNIINEIREKNDIVDIVSSYIPLIQKGKNYFGLCPFHDDKNPSMSVSREKGIYTCFSCGASGNVFTFLMNYEHISFKEALIELAKKANVNLSNISIKSENNKYSEAYNIYNIANKYYQNNLNTKEGLNARNYLKKRFISEDIIKHFGIGLSLNKKEDLTKLLHQKKYSDQLLESIGISNSGHDMYINRIMFPLCDINGRVVGFSGRIYDNSNVNKYVNTKETAIFKKGLCLYNYHLAKEETRKLNKVIVMEGFLDVIRAYSIGIKNTVALMGTALTKEQANLIRKLSTNIYLCMDGDDPGQQATISIGKYFENYDVNIKVIELDKDYDPDTYILKYRKEGFDNLINKAINFSDYKIKTLRRTKDLKSEKEIAAYINEVLKEISNDKDEIHQELIMKKLANEFNIEYNTLCKKLRDINKKKVSKEELIVPKEKKKKNKFDISLMAIIYYMLNNEEVINYYNRNNIYLDKDVARFLANEVAYYYKKYGIINVADFYTYLQDKKELLLYLNEILSFNFNDELKMDAIIDYFLVIENYNQTEEVKRLMDLMEKESDLKDKAKIAERIRKLKMGSEEND
ncbi:MAG: DNA primase [Tenericutes bacterium]|jgi:DNA primase|nr:DNA primase [Mycoplasmatota bacterium]